MTPFQADPAAPLPVQSSLLSSRNAIQVPLGSEQEDAKQILAFLEQVKQTYIRAPEVREFTVSLLRGLANNDQIGQVNRIIDFVRKNVTYIRDPIDSEYVVTPVQMIRQYVRKHFIAGDCDDHVLLLNTMLGCVGFYTKFVGVKYGQTSVYNHVISGVEFDNHLYLVDPCSKSARQPKYTDTLILP